MGETFVRRLRGLSGQDNESLATALKSSTQPVCIRSAFDLPQGQRTAIQQAINETFSAEIRLQFETATDLVSGIELSAGGQKVAWSIADYLATLERIASDLLDKEQKPERLATPSKPTPLGANPEPKRATVSEAKT